jgi:hypothetical protein
MQLDLFGPPTAPSTLPTIPAPRPCRCGGTQAALGSSHAMHAARLTCADCGAFLGWASHALVNEIRGFTTGLSTFAPGCAP